MGRKFAYVCTTGKCFLQFIEDTATRYVLPDRS